MKNVFVYQFENSEQKEEFKNLCLAGGLTMHEKFNQLVNNELGKKMVVIDKEKIKFDKQLELARNRAKINEILKEEKRKLDNEEKEKFNFGMAKLKEDQERLKNERIANEEKKHDEWLKNSESWRLSENKV